jgi:hypothetical protein
MTPAHARKRSSFDSPLRSTLATLTTELRALTARHPVLEVAIPADQFRIDGRPRANARETHPGVVLSLPHTSVGALRYATDTFTSWQDNLRGIALGLEALRKVDRYGITRRGEQYAGFKALPAGSGAVSMPAAAMTVEEAARVLARAANLLSEAAAQTMLDPVTRAIVWRDAVKKHHPDVGGDRATWDRLEQAKRVLDEHGGARA